MRFPLLVLFLLTVSILPAQTSICDDDACSPELDDINLDLPRDPAGGQYTDARLATFSNAYNRFRAVRENQQASPGFRERYATSDLGGRRCLKYYDLDSRFAYEYDKNPAFATYVDQLEPDAAAFQRRGFESSRRGMNLQARLERDCPREARRSEKDGTSELADRRAVYQRLGEVQGYWDEAGNTLKPLEAIPAAPANATGRRKSKKQRVEDLTQALAALPAGPATQDKIDQLTSGYDKVSQRADQLTDKLGQATQLIDGLLPKPGGLADQIGSLLGLKKPLSDYVPKIKGSGLVDKVKGWFSKGKKLKDRADQLRNQAQRVKDDLAGTVAKAKETAEKIKQNAKDVATLGEALKDLQKQKNDLSAKLGDKPKKIVDELEQQMAAANQKAKDLRDRIADGAADKDKLQKELDRLDDKRQELTDKIEDINEKVDDLTKKEADLKKAGDELEAEADRLRRQEDLLTTTQNTDIPADAKQKAKDCAEALAELLGQTEKVEEKQKKRRFSLGKLLALPGKLIGKVTGFLDKHAALKTILGAIPGVSNVMNLVDGLFNKSKGVAKVLEAITGKQQRLTETLNGIAGQVENVKQRYEDGVAKVKNVTDKIDAFAGQKTALVGLLSKPLSDLTDAEARVADLVRDAGLLGEGSPCGDLSEPQREMEEAEAELDEMEPEIEEMAEELEEAEAEVEEIETETDAVEQEVEQIQEQAEEVEREEEAIREQFGQEVDLEPVTVEEWSESFAVERPYWKADFHPDDEVVEGYRGRYFQVQLKEADQAIKLLFGPGEYHISKSDFRDRYGAVIGAFVTESLAAIRSGDREGIRLFVQGSADISGARSFRGNLDESFYYDELNLLPLRGSENFGGQAETRSVKERGFTNEDLPNLRGRYLQEMIGFYSKKLQPVLLEGSVKDVVDEADRNAVIYLFLPEALVGE